MNGRRRIALIATAVVCMSVVAGCGSDSKNSSATTARTIVDASTVPPVDTTATTPATEPTADTTAATVLDTTGGPTTTVDTRPINADDQALALAATLHTEDFATPWTQYSPGVAFSASADSCSYEPAGAITKVANGGLQTGPTEQLGDTGAYSSSASLVFPDESVSVAYIALINSEAWGTCQVGKLQEIQDNAGSTNVVKLATRTEPTLNQNGFESYAEFDVVGTDGATNRIVLFSYYRIARTVIVTVLDYSGLSQDDFTKFQNDAYQALLAAYGRVNAF
jgi:hypothetical protein